MAPQLAISKILDSAKTRISKQISIILWTQQIHTGDTAADRQVTYPDPLSNCTAWDVT